jgi:hypothetical protein
MTEKISRIRKNVDIAAISQVIINRIAERQLLTDGKTLKDGVIIDRALKALAEKEEVIVE